MPLCLSYVSSYLHSLHFFGIFLHILFAAYKQPFGYDRSAKYYTLSIYGALSTPAPGTRFCILMPSPFAGHWTYDPLLPPILLHLADHALHHSLLCMNCNLCILMRMMRSFSASFFQGAYTPKYNLL